MVMSSSKRRPAVREPIQVYLTRAERARLDQLARDLGVSRAEALRQGLDALAERRGGSFYDAFDPLVGGIDDRTLPADLAERHDLHLAHDLELRKGRSRRRSS
jgi:hypothetical protein